MFVDPAENVVTVQTNSVEVIGSGGAVTTVFGATSQVYAGTVNGTVIAPAIAQQSYQNQPYYPFNLTNLSIGDAPTTPPPPPPPPPPSPPPPALAAPIGLIAGQARCQSDHSFVERSDRGRSLQRSNEALTA